MNHWKRAGAALLAAAILTFSAGDGDAAQIRHTVRKGQYLNLIAKRYHTTADAIRKSNGLGEKADLKVGAKLVIEMTEAHAQWRAYYIRKHGKAPPETVIGEEKAPAKKRETKRKPRSEPKKRAKRAPEKRKRNAGKGSSEPKRSTKRATKASDDDKVDDKYKKTPDKPGHVNLVRQGESFEGQLVASNGKTIAKNTKKLDKLLRSFRTGEEHKIDRDLVKLFTQVSDYYGGRQIVIVSGFRPFTKKQFTPNSRHNHGKAIDFRVTDVPVKEVWKLCKTFENVGCGYYPTSGFVHMDVRKKKTQWIDYAGPGQAPIYAHKSKKKGGSKSSTKGGSDDKASAKNGDEPKKDGKGADAPKKAKESKKRDAK